MSFRLGGRGKARRALVEAGRDARREAANLGSTALSLDWQPGLIAAERVFEFLDAPIDIQEADDAQAIQHRAAAGGSHGR